MTEQEKHEEKMRLQYEIAKRKMTLQKYKEDVEQVELFSMERSDYEQKKEFCKNIVLELRSLEQQMKNLEQ